MAEAPVYGRQRGPALPAEDGDDAPYEHSDHRVPRPSSEPRPSPTREGTRRPSASRDW